jgi:hypothetical protein
MKKNFEKLDVVLYLISFISLFFILLLLTSSKSINYDIDKNFKNYLDKKQETLREIYFSESLSNTKKIYKEAFYKGQKLDYKEANEIESVNNYINNSNISMNEKRELIYIVKKGDTLYRIAKIYNVSIKQLAIDNNINNIHLIRIGMKIKISLLEKNYETIGEYKVKKFGIKKKLKFIWPLKGRISSEFGVRTYPTGKMMDFHTGIDIAAPIGKEFVAAEDGYVIFVGVKGGYGLLIIIEHPNGYKTFYGHTLISLVKPGQYVKKGDIIGRVGDSGSTTGPHLHFEIRKNDVAYDPTNFINKRLLFY